ncbi:MAG: hypothetical protein ACTSYI_09370 [Promethearchaeota archaeon]
MTNIEIDFSTFLPTLSTFYNYFEILKAHKFIHDIEVVNHENGDAMLRVLRKESLNLF